MPTYAVETIKDALYHHKDTAHMMALNDVDKKDTLEDDNTFSQYTIWRR